MISSHIQSFSEPLIEDNYMNSNTPIYAHNNVLNCMEIKLNEKTFLFDYDGFCKILNHKRNFIFTETNEMYPSYIYNARRINYLEFLYLDGDVENYRFINGNNCDLRKENVSLIHKQSEYVYANYEVLEYIPGHYPTNKHRNIMKNSMWRVKINDTEKLIMYCEPESFCILCPESYKKICEYETNVCNKKLTYYISNGYVATQITGEKSLMMHQIIMNHHGNGKGTKNTSIDHIDRNRLNNSLDNLRIVDHETQQQNKIGSLPGTKRNRQYNARELPEGITHDMLRKYVVYNKEVYNKSKNLSRDYFRVDHPKLSTPWESSKSCEVSCLDKLNAANKVAADLDNEIMPQKKERDLPAYFRYETKNNKQYLVFDRRHNGKRCNMQVKLSVDFNIEEELKKARKMLVEKYDETIFNVYSPALLPTGNSAR